ncbi:MAG: lysyl-tRNA synthetase, class [Actinoplanes sp.]|nr:lysyl-tRNA synthetase, class [Actinoplanes sp.]
MGSTRAGAAGALLIVGALVLARPDAVLGGSPPPLVRIALAVLLILLARGLVGRRRLARQSAVVLVAVAVVVPPIAPGRLALLAAVGALAVAYPRGYVVRPDPHRLRAACLAAAVAVGLSLGRGLWEATRHPVRQAAHQALPLLPAASDRSTQVFAGAVFAVLLAAVALALAPWVAPAPGDESERARVRELVQEPGSGSLAPFATRADKSYVFSPDGRAVIGFRVHFGVALAGGDPAGATESAGAAVTAFARLCAQRGWRPAVLGADAADARLWQAVGVRRAVEIGDEAVLPVASFSAAGRAMRNVRQAARRAQNAGVRVGITELDAALAARLAPVLRDWLHGQAERGFAMNLDAILKPRADVLIAVARDPAGRPVAFARFARAAGGRLLSLDVVPRGRDAPNGVVELIVLETVDHARSHGIAEVSLNFAGMRRVYAGRGPAARLAQVPLKALDRWIELDTLYRFTAKFHPLWRARQLRMRSWLDLVPVATAALTAEFGARATAVAAVAVPAAAPGLLSDR